jgi:UDP:flavonoid glycosyltransferase YjiC (YdhE family)
VSLGTLFNARIDFFEQCVKGFADSEYVLVLVVGDNVDAGALSDLPDNIILRRFVRLLRSTARVVLSDAVTDALVHSNARTLCQHPLERVPRR